LRILSVEGVNGPFIFSQPTLARAVRPGAVEIECRRRSWGGSTLCGVVASIGRLLGLVALAFVAVLRLWYRAVLLAPEVKRRKAARRAARRA